jgi:hypothetical protein
MNVLLSTTYFGPIQWYQKLNRADEAWIERYESFQKQTYRNRCIIATTQGTQALTVPVERSNSQSSIPQFLKDIRISDHGNWRHLHWNALQSAYGDSPFFMYYEDDLRPFFEQRWDYLLDFNEAIREKICELLDIQPNIRYTAHYLPSLSRERLRVGASAGMGQGEGPFDYREAINPKHPGEDPDFTPRRYYQVYEAKHGFLPNLSILDLLFNMGPESVFWL